MANETGINVEITGDASGLANATKQAERSLNVLYDAQGRVISRLGRTSGAAGAAAQSTKKVGHSARISAEDFNALSTALNKSARQLGNSSARAKTLATQQNKARIQAANLTAQFNDIGVMLASGQSPFLLAMQQGTQVNQVLDQLGRDGASRLGTLKSAFMSAISPVNLLTIGIIAGGAALVQWGMKAAQAEEETTRLAERLEATREKMTKIGEEVRALRLGVSEEELALIDKIAEVQKELAEQEALMLKERGRGESRLRQEQRAVIQERIDALKAELEKYRQQQAEKEKLTAQQAHINEMAEVFLRAQQRIRKENGETAEQSRKLAERIGQAGVEALELAGIDISSGVDAATEAAARLAGQLGVSLERARQLAGMTANEAAGSMQPGGGMHGPSGPAGLLPPDLSGSANQWSTDKTRGEGRYAPAKKGGGGGGLSPREQMEKDWEQLREKLRTEEEIELESYQRKQEQLQEFLDNKLITQQQYNDAMERAQRQHQETMSNIDKYRYGTGLEKAETFMGDMASALQSGNERMQRISQAFASVEALINAWRAFSQTMADPSLPWYAKIPTAMGVLAAGMNAVNAIKGAGSGGGTAAAAGGAARGGGRARRGGGGGGSGSSGAGGVNQYYNIQLTGEGPIGRDSVRNLIEQLNEAIEDGAVLKGIVVS